jgi:hypothetical protein
MAETGLVELEATLKRLPGVLGCVILANTDGTPSEIQAFTQVGADRDQVQEAIRTEVAKAGLDGKLKQVFVFELEAESHFGDRESLTRAAEVAEQEARSRGPARQVVTRPPGKAPASVRARPPILRVSFSSTNWNSEAEVALGSAEDEVVGQATGEKTPHGLKVLAAATLEAVQNLVGDSEIELKGASLVSMMGEEAVLVLVSEQGGPDLLGAALVKGGPVAEAAVKATLDAVNRRLAMVAGGR